MGALFQHLDIHKTTWVSPCGKYKNQIDHIAVSRRHRSSLLDVHVKQGADIGSDHQLSISKIRFKLKSQRDENPVAHQYDIDLLRRNGNEKDEFKIECRNRFLVLEEEEQNVEESSGELKEVLHGAAGRTIRRRSRLRRKEWISKETWNVIRKRAETKVKSARHNICDRDIELARAVYKSFDSEVKGLTTRDKGRSIDEEVVKTETLINKNDGHSQRLAYEGIKELNGSGRKRREMPVRDGEGNLLIKNVDIRNRWREHFQTILKRPVPPEEEIPPAQEDLNIDTGEIRLEEGGNSINPWTAKELT